MYKPIFGVHNYSMYDNSGDFQHNKMADVNICTRKRKLSSQECESEVIDEDEGVGGSQLSTDLEIFEPDSKVIHLQEKLSQNTDSNLESLVNSQNSDESVGLINQDVKEKLLEFEDEIQRLRSENEVLKSKLCSCPKPQITDDKELIMSISFSSSANFELYKEKLMKLLEPLPELCASVEENNSLICFTKDIDIISDDWVIVDKEEVKLLRSNNKKKKKSKKPEKDEELFVLDTTPSITTKRDLFYESKFSVLSKPNENENNSKSANLTACFNCNESHNLRDCPQPKNYMKINAARQKFKSQQTTKSLRYHLEDDQRFAHLQPGKISEKLHKALGLRHNQVPAHIYRMRQLGYPPGWLNELQANNQSELVLFDFEGKNTFDQKVKVQDLDPDKIIEYAGFNVPLAKGVKDEHRLYGCPSYSKEQNKQNMLIYMQGIRKKAQDNLETCDMDIDNATSSDKEIETNKLSNHSKDKHIKSTDEIRDYNASPTLCELESKKQKLLAELTENNSNSLQSSEGLEEANEKTMDETVEEGEGFKTLDITGTIEDVTETIEDITGTVDDLDETVENTIPINNCDTPIIISNVVRNSCFGTPILKSSSPYCRLPNPENFSQNVSQVINFENLPNSTGKYEQMVGVLDKVRKTLKSLSDQKS
ncbi:hypothetical protein ILUMI_25869 [Ignelater luminosus]|uniref:PSP proline-rich domain-containing protein n=1 Tax=Ignelater luminosus TaxID=2038154 RepID=A0A8K0C7N0_IGNLU|nr:hypothetical protein ILUMI_25869 [Ignelater luminosus]